MHRRRLLKLGLASTVALALAGGSLALLRPGLAGDRLSGAGKLVLAALGRAVLDGNLPSAVDERERAIAGLLDRIDALVQGLPDHARSELSQLLAVLASAPGRLAFLGLSQDWTKASVMQLQQGLEAMRMSSLALRRQAYLALHDIVLGAYFSDPGTWKQLGYPGPTKL